jgi:sugar/nucleoside kinase (ribokinase family)
MMADVGCAGILVDDTFCGPMKRLPQPGELLALDEMRYRAGGCAANVAIDLARQGIGVDVCGCVGADGSGAMLVENLRTFGVGCDEIHRLDSYPTSKTVILVVDGEDRRYLHVFGANAGFTVGRIRRNWLHGLKVFYLGGLFAMPAICAEELAELLADCRRHGIATVVDVVLPQAGVGMESLLPLLPQIDYFLPNDDEAQRLTGLSDVEQQMEAFLGHGVGTIVITCGSGGAKAACGSRRWRSDAFRVECVDPSGAGDAFAAGIITGAVHRWDFEKTLRYAALLGASATTAVGATDGVLTAEQARQVLDQQRF